MKISCQLVVKRLIVELDFERMNFQNGDRLDMDNATGGKQDNEQQQERTKA